MFQFPGFAPSHDGGRPSTCRVAPFGYSRIKSCLQIPATFRSLPRPSSPPDSLGILRSLFHPFSVFATPFLRYPRRPAPLASSQHNGCSGGAQLGRLDLERNFAANCLISESQSWCIIHHFLIHTCIHFVNLCLFEIVVPNFYEKTHILLQTFSILLFFTSFLFSQYCQ